MAEVTFPIIFEECPNCGCKDTTCRLAFKQEIVDKGKGPEVFVSSAKLAMPLSDPRSAALTLPVLLEHYDTCAKCGLRYCTKAEITTGNIGVIPQSAGHRQSVVPGIGPTHPLKR